MKEAIQFVITGKNRSKGFVLLQTLLAFSLFLLIISLIPLMVGVVSHKNEASIHSMEVQIFFHQLAFEIKQGKNLRVEGGKISLTNRHGEEVSIEKYQDKVRRRVENSGHDVMLQRVKSINFQLVNHGVFIQIVDSFGNKYEHRISRAYSAVG